MVTAALSQFVYLQDVMKQRNAALVGLSLCKLEQRADLEAFGIPCVTSLEGDPYLNMEGSVEVSANVKYVWE